MMDVGGLLSKVPPRGLPGYFSRPTPKSLLVLPPPASGAGESLNIKVESRLASTIVPAPNFFSYSGAPNLSYP